MTITANESPTTVSEVILGIDTHKDVHVAVALNQLGRRLGELTVPTTTKGYEKLFRWAEGFGPVCCAGVEGTGSYGAGLARWLKAAGILVMEDREAQTPSSAAQRQVRPHRCGGSGSGGHGRRYGWRAKER